MDIPVRRFILSFGAFLSLALLGACSLPPQSNERNSRAQDAVQRAEQTPVVTQHAPLKLQQAKQSLAKAESIWDEHGNDREDLVEHHAYLAERQALTALQEAEMAEGRDRVAEASETREEVLRKSREEQLLTAQRRAAQAERQAESARQRAQSAEQQYETSQQDEADRLQAGREDEQLQELRRTVENLQAQQTDRGMVLTLNDVLFDFGEAELKPGGERSVEQLASFLEENPDRRLLVEGYTDSVGEEQFNEELGRRRADAVRAKLEEAGISADRIEIASHGENYPVASNESTAGRQLNRRVEVVIGTQDRESPEPRSGEEAESQSNPEQAQ